MKKFRELLHLVAARASIAGVIGVVALVLSTALSGSGIYFSLENTSLSGPAKVLTASVSTFLLTLLAFRFWLMAGRESTEARLRSGHAALAKKSARPFILVGLAMSSLSVFTATTALVFVSNRDGVQAMMNYSSFSGTIAPVNIFADSMAAVASSASRADALAAERSQREAAVGGTCGVSKPGVGPLTRMRAEHAASANTLADSAKVLNETAQRIAQRLVVASDQAVVDDLFSEARALRLDPRRLVVAEKAEELALGYNGRGFVYEGRRRMCPDPELAALFGEIETTARGVVNLPEQPPVRRNVKVFDAFAMVLPLLLDGTLGQSFGVSRATILPFVFFALLIDLVSLGGAWVHGAGKAVRMSEAEKRQLHRTAWVLRNFVWEFPPQEVFGAVGEPSGEECQAFIYVPIGGDPVRMRQAEFLTALFDLSIDPALQFEPLIARRKEFEPWVEMMSLASGGASHYAVYPIASQETYDRIMQMKRDALRALALMDLETSEFPEFESPSRSRVVRFRAA